MLCHCTCVLGIWLYFGIKASGSSLVGIFKFIILTFCWKLWANFSWANIWSIEAPYIMMDVVMYWDPDNLVLSRCLRMYGFVSCLLVSQVLSGLKSDFLRYIFGKMFIHEQNRVIKVLGKISSQQSAVIKNHIYDMDNLWVYILKIFICFNWWIVKKAGVFKAVYVCIKLLISPPNAGQS